MMGEPTQEAGWSMVGGQQVRAAGNTAQGLNFLVGATTRSSPLALLLLFHTVSGFAKMTTPTVGRGVVVESFGDPSVMRVKEVTVRPPGEGEVLIAIEAAGVNPVDTYIRSGTYAAGPSLPYTPGKDGAGVVRAVGPGVEKLRVNDRVYVTTSVTGTYATHAIANAKTVHRLPPNVPFTLGAGCGVPFHTAYRALVHKARAKKGEKVLIHGASGGVGLAAVQLAKSKGLYVVGSAGTAEGEKLVKQFGADEVVNHRDSAYVDKLVSLVPQGFDVILEMLANVNLETDLQLAAKGGRIAIIGNRGSININPRGIMGKELQVLGVMLYGATQDEEEEAAAEAYRMLESGAFTPFVSTQYPLEAAPQAHIDVITPAKGGAAGNLVIVPSLSSSS